MLFRSWSVFEALLRRYSTVLSVSEAQNYHIDLVGNIGLGRLNVLASFEPSSGSLNPLEGIAFCIKVISACLGQYCALGLCGNFGP